jgi:adenine/guanine phosphoribosyltransferase-like PRPP-binding protein
VAATVRLIEQCGGVPHAFAGLLELGFLDPRQNTGDLPVVSVVTL